MPWSSGRSPSACTSVPGCLASSISADLAPTVCEYHWPTVDEYRQFSGGESAQYADPRANAPTGRPCPSWGRLRGGQQASVASAQSWLSWASTRTHLHLDPGCYWTSPTDPATPVTPPGRCQQGQLRGFHCHCSTPTGNGILRFRPTLVDRDLGSTKNHGLELSHSGDGGITGCNAAECQPGDKRGNRQDGSDCPCPVSGGLARVWQSQAGFARDSRTGM